MNKSKKVTNHTAKNVRDAIAKLDIFRSTA